MKQEIHPCFLEFQNGQNAVLSALFGSIYTIIEENIFFLMFLKIIA